MKPTATITVLLYRRPDGFHALAGACERVHPNSSTCAARAAAAEWFGVGEAAVEVTPAGPDMLTAEIKRLASPVAWSLLFGAAGAVATFVAAWLLTGGGR